MVLYGRSSEKRRDGRDCLTRVDACTVRPTGAANAAQFFTLENLGLKASASKHVRF